MTILSFKYVEDNGLTVEQSYPYVAYQSDCLAKRFGKVLLINDTFEGKSVLPDDQFIPKLIFELTEEINGDEEHLKFLVYNYGPIVVVIYASDGFTQYAGGIFSESDCPNDMNRFVSLKIIPKV